ncbi:integrase, catalytic region, zinc finger, CCHC-type containing protein, partial [Tanacetum coccineum]
MSGSCTELHRSHLLSQLIELNVNSFHDLCLEALDSKQIGEDFIMSSTETVYKLEPREPL